MSSASPNSPSEGYFNDLSHPTGNNGRNKRQRSPTNENGVADGTNEADSNTPKLKRIACIICRKRKLKCDGTKPSCSTCTRLGHDCAYDEARKKSGPKRGYVKALEERLSEHGQVCILYADANTSSEQVETLLKTQDPGIATAEIPNTSFTSGSVNGIGLHTTPSGDFGVQTPSIGMAEGAERWQFSGESPQAPIDNLTFSSDINMGMGLDDNTFTWEMIGLGLEEPLPPQDTIDDLYVFCCRFVFDYAHITVVIGYTSKRYILLFQ
jgi:hypothetical protein